MSLPFDRDRHQRGSLIHLSMVKFIKVQSQWVSQSILRPHEILHGEAKGPNGCLHLRWKYERCAFVEVSVAVGVPG